MLLLEHPDGQFGIIVDEVEDDVEHLRRKKRHKKKHRTQRKFKIGAMSLTDFLYVILNGQKGEMKFWRRTIST